MLPYLFRRLGAGIVLVFLVTGITFALTYTADIPVARNILGPQATDEQIAILNARLGLDKPLWEQYTDWLGGLFHGDLGKSYFSGQDVTDALTSRLPVTLSVVVVAMIITLLASTALGIASAARRGWLDNLLQGISTISFVFPGIILGIALVYVFAIELRWVPATGYTKLADDPRAWFSSVILPAIVLSIGGIAALAAQVRGSLIDELDREYVRTLRARGVSERSLLLKHALRNAAGPALTTFSLQFISIFGAALFVEKIFALPGYGSYAFNATLQGDLPALLGVTVFGVLLVVIVNLLVDLAQGWLNPKARLA
ncbi:ABC transporter permease [Blastococcus sp. URHD0036]|uniref:ABC transporter permease n=1 Tax=Blastococcus sp. URHD0036 TaxID=1380356 RepID=UPI00049659D9|nr:ABC transporter permease [Blastococcus sp. URHD0036]